MKKLIKKIDIGIIVNIVIASSVLGGFIYFLNLYSDVKFLKLQVSNHIPTQLNELNNRIDRVEQRLDRVEQRLDQIYKILIEIKNK